MRKFLAICFRLSIVVALIVAAVQLFQIHTRAVEMERRDREIWMALECAAKVPDERLQQHLNQFGNFDIGKVGCASRQFWAAPDEIEKARRGEINAFVGVYPGPTFFVESAAMGAFAAFVGINLIGLTVVGVWAIARWVAWGRVAT